MAAKTLRYADWLKRLDRTGVGAGYLLIGPESLLRDQAIRAIKERMGASVDHDRFDGGEVTLSRVASAFSTVGLFSPSRLVTLSDLERTARSGAAERESLLSQLQRGGGGSVFLAWSDLTWRELERKGEWLGRLAEICPVVELWHPRPEEALRWLLEESRRRGLLLSADAGELLLERMGPHLQDLLREVEKLELGIEPGTRVTAESLGEFLRHGGQASVWDFCDQVLSSRSAAALRTWDSLRNAEPVLRVQWLLQQKAREGSARNPGPGSRLQEWVLRAYELERGIKTGRIGSGNEEIAFECSLAGSMDRGHRPSTIRST